MEKREEFIEKNKDLFWSIHDSKKKFISDNVLVETILNYGAWEDVRELFNLLGLKQTAEVFYIATENRERKNYFPQVENFFKLYFDYHVRQHSV
jgi:hypothetical protein